MILRWLSLYENLVRRNGILFQTDSIPFPDDHEDYSNQEEWRGRTIVDEVVHSKH